ncbi:uncharacterized protein [Atheta coriaria]|uniref:uncharacterized protein n=1 Tax=Dalotia coriaria TaxID=877792 RepID=UPI0031F3F4E0
MGDPALRHINENENHYMNILLLGETGTGKSTFINSFFNYLQFPSLNDAIDVPELTCLIPAKFSITTQDGDTQEVHFKKDDNENDQLGSSSTLCTKSYVFPFGTKNIRIIDTPGINDTQGAIIKDRDNFLNILEYIGQLSNLHAICFLMKPDVTSITAAYKYCLAELLSRLNRSAADNIIFLFTRTRSTDYHAPDTINCLKKVLDEIAKKEGVTIPLRYKSAEHRNCFFFENEGFKYLIAKQQGLQMLNPKQHEKSWEVSYNSTWDLIKYIEGDEKNPQLPPHDVQQTVSVNRARLLILELAKPLADLSDLTEDNVRAIQKHIENIARENITAEELKQKLYIPAVGLDVRDLQKPVTVCAAGQCTETYVVGDIKKNHYKQRCHNPCYLEGVAADIIGDAILMGCAAMNGNNCKECGCHYSLHMHVYYETTTIETKIKNETVVSRIATQEEMIKVQYDQIRLLEKRKAEYINEHKEITTALATFSFFLCNNSICVINDAYEEYLNVLIQNAKRRDSLESSLADRYESLKREYIEEKRQINLIIIMDDQVLRQINENEHEFINILLLGETGTGKSTFINSFCNYLQFSSLNDAIDVPELTCLIPAKFSITTEDGDTQEVHFKKDDNENNQLGSSSTLRTKSYVFPFETKLIRIIDTPGINDTQGAIIKDRDNFLNILDYIGQLSNLHAICFLMKPDVTSITAAYKYCLIELLSRLNRSAANNIIFLFTRTRSTDYRAPETINCLKRVLDEIAKKEGVTIPLRYKSAEHRNCFFFENEGFKYLIAKQQGLQMLNPRQHKESWEVSYNSTRDLINYIVGDEKHPPLPPHDVQQTVSVNRARLLILELAKPLADLTEDNVRAIQKHIENIARENMTAEELKQILYIPCVGLDVENLEKPVTVCAAGQCTETYVVGDIKKYHYKQRCHNPCFLRGVAADIIGDAKLLRCAAMIGNNCKKCGCHYSLHMHVYYETTTIQTRIKNETVVSRIATQEEMIKTQYDQIRLLEKRKAEYINEHKEITTALAKFSFFLSNNSICVINDAYEEYLNVLIQNAKRRDSLESSLVDRYQSLKREYIEEKRQITEAARLAKKQNITHVTSDQILETYLRLINLPLSGETIKILHKIFKQGSHNEQMMNTEYVHSKIFKTPVSPAQKVNSRNEGQDTRNITLLPIEYASGTKSYNENQLVPMGAIRKELCQIAYTGGETSSDNTENARSEISFSDMQQYIAERRGQVQAQSLGTKLIVDVVKDKPPKDGSTAGWFSKVSHLMPGSSTKKTDKTETKNNL